MDQLKALLDEWDTILAKGPVFDWQFDRWVILAKEAYKSIDAAESFDFVRNFPVINDDSTNAVFSRCIRGDIGIIRAKIEAKERFGILQTKVVDSIPVRAGSKRVFIIHGHNDAIREAVARFVAKLGLEPVILFERPNGGKTIIEKFEKEANVGFAIALLTADDTAICKKDQKQETRARQNVVFELGYFAAKLGRERVAVLKQAGVAEPSDLHGIVYTELDSKGAWKVELAKELRAAGFEIDMNKAF